MSLAVLLSLAGAAIAPLVSAQPYPSIDGSGHTTLRPNDNVAGGIFQPRRAYYADQVSSINPGLPNARLLSNIIFKSSTFFSNSHGISQLTASWGQFLAHDLILTQPHTTNVSDTLNVLSIPIPMCDEHFDAICTGTRSLTFKRTSFDPTTGTSAANPRRQKNGQTGFIDASVVYGTSASRLAALRTFHRGLLIEGEWRGCCSRL